MICLDSKNRSITVKINVEELYCLFEIFNTWGNILCNVKFLSLLLNKGGHWFLFFICIYVNIFWNILLHLNSFLTHLKSEVNITSLTQFINYNLVRENLFKSDSLVMASELTIVKLILIGLNFPQFNFSLKCRDKNCFKEFIPTSNSFGWPGKVKTPLLMTRGHKPTFF